MSRERVAKCVATAGSGEVMRFRQVLALRCRRAGPRRKTTGQHAALQRRRALGQPVPQGPVLAVFAAVSFSRQRSPRKEIARFWADLLRPSGLDQSLDFCRDCLQVS